MGVPLDAARYVDCGMLIFSPEQDVHAGGSGCGCSASVLCGYIMRLFREKAIHRVAFMATGALLSPTFSQQGGAIPGIAHLIVLRVRTKHDDCVDLIKAFLVGGALCMIGEILLLKTKLTPGADSGGLHCRGGIFERHRGIRAPCAVRRGGRERSPDWLRSRAGDRGEARSAGNGPSGRTGGLTNTAAGISAAVFFGVLMALIFQPRAKKQGRCPCTLQGSSSLDPFSRFNW